MYKSEERLPLEKIVGSRRQDRYGFQPGSTGEQRRTRAVPAVRESLQRHWQPSWMRRALLGKQRSGELLVEEFHFAVNRLKHDIRTLAR